MQAPRPAAPAWEGESFADVDRRISGQANCAGLLIVCHHVADHLHAPAGRARRSRASHRRRHGAGRCRRGGRDQDGSARPDHRAIWALHGPAVAHGDLGQSYLRPRSGMIATGGQYIDPTKSDMAPVTDLILERLPFTLQLGGVALVFALLISLPIGIAGGLHPQWMAEQSGLRRSIAVRFHSEFLAGDRPDPVPFGEARICCRRLATRASPIRSCLPSCSPSRSHPSSSAR